MPRKPARLLAAERRRDILACAPGLLLRHRGLDSCGQIARHLGLRSSSLRAQVSNEAELVRLLCHIHLNDIFAALCQNIGCRVLPSNALLAMAQALLDTAASHAARHRIYLLHRFMLGEESLRALDILRATIDNCFHFALHAAAPERPFRALRQPAGVLVGQLLHAPLWWPDGTESFRTHWLANQIGFVAALPAERIQTAGF